MKEFKLLIPLADNSGKSFSDQTIADFQSACIKRFGGLSNGGNVVGYWTDGNKIYRDTNIVYFLATNDIQEIKSLLAEWNSVFQQEAFYIMEMGNANIVNKADL